MAKEHMQCVVRFQRVSGASVEQRRSKRKTLRGVARRLVWAGEEARRPAAGHRAGVENLRAEVRALGP